MPTPDSSRNSSITPILERLAAMIQHAEERQRKDEAVAKEAAKQPARRQTVDVA